MNFYEKNIMETINELMLKPIGICNAEGYVLYPDKFREVNMQLNINLYDNFVYSDGMGFLKCAVSSCDEAYFFMESDEFSCKQMLGLASLLMKKENTGASEKKKNFYKKLLLGEVGTDKADTENGSRPEEVIGYTVIYIKNIHAEILNESVFEVISSIYPEEMGYHVIETDEDAIAVIAALDKGNTYEDVRNLADAVPETVSAEAMANVCVSIGCPVSTLEEIHKSFGKALMNCETGLAFGITDGCIDEKKLGLATLFYNVPDDVCLEYIHQVLGNLEKEERNGTELSETVECFLANNQNISETSRILYVHRNTLTYRIEKFNKITGFDCTKFEDGMKIRTAIMLEKYMRKKKNDKR